MNNRNATALKWLKNRLQRKYKIPPEMTEKVLCAIGDLKWDWRTSNYDLYGLDLQEIIEELGEQRNPHKHTVEEL